MRNTTTYSEYCKPSSTVLVSVPKKYYPDAFYVPVVGTGEKTDDTCGKTKIALKCSNGAHKPILKPFNCSNAMCPTCFKYWISGAVTRVSTHLTALYQTIRYDEEDKDSIKTYKKLNTLSKHPYRHWVVSFPDNLKLKEKPYDILKQFRELSVYGVALYHPYRLTAEGKQLVKKLRDREDYVGGNWEIWHAAGLYMNPNTYYMSPHLHILMAGFVPVDFQEKLRRKGYIIKCVRKVGFSEDEINPLLSYLFTHAGYFGNSKSYRYFGVPKMVTVVVNTRWSEPEPVLCPICGEPMRQFRYCDDGTYIDEGYAVESHLVYESFLTIRKKIKPSDAKYADYVRLTNKLKIIIEKEERRKECIRSEHIMLFR